jgi:molecular chaperone GrpE
VESKSKQDKQDKQDKSEHAELIKKHAKDLRKLKEQIKELEEYKLVSQAELALSEQNALHMQEKVAQHERLQAEFRQYRKRTDEQMQTLRQEGAAQAAISILPVLDITYQALGMTTDDKSLDGLSKIAQKIEGVLEALGLEEIPSVGEVFDPSMHEALVREDVGTDQKDRVVEVFSKGYKLGDKVLRHSSVKVGG